MIDYVMWIWAAGVLVGSLSLGYLEYREEREYRESEFKAILVGVSWFAFWWAIFTYRVTHPFIRGWWERRG